MVILNRILPNTVGNQLSGSSPHDGDSGMPDSETTADATNSTSPTPSSLTSALCATNHSTSNMEKGDDSDFRRRHKSSTSSIHESEKNDPLIAGKPNIKCTSSGYTNSLGGTTQQNHVNSSHTNGSNTSKTTSNQINR